MLSKLTIIKKSGLNKKIIHEIMVDPSIETGVINMMELDKSEELMSPVFQISDNREVVR